MILLQILLFASFSVLLYFLRSYEKRFGKALSRIGLTFITVLFYFSVAFPQLTEKVANFLGVGRGADLVAYATTFGLIGASIIFIVKIKQFEKQVSLLNRELSLIKAKLRKHE
jgi:hypothetical protein